MIPDVVSANPLPNYRLKLSFDTGDSGVVDVAALLEQFTGIFAPLRDENYFAQASVNRDIGTVVWPNGADIDPIMLYAHATGNFDVLKPYQESYHG